MRPFGPDLRERIHQACLDRAGTSEVASRFLVSTAFVRRLRQRYRESNSLAPRTPAAAVRLRLAAYEQVLRQAVHDFPDRTPAEHKEHLGLPASTSTVWRMLGRLGLSRKKTRIASEREREDVKHRRADWPDRLAGVASEDLVFVDEAGANTTMTLTHGYAPKGERLTASVPHGHYKTIAFVAASTMAGMTAPFAMDRAMNGPWFLAWIEQALLPLLRPGMVIVMDNLPAHKVAGVREAIARAGCRVEYLPPYSPDLNPIENAFSKFKARLRKEGRRTVDGVYEAMRLAVDDISARDCRGYFRHCGHRPATPT